ncbi:MAG: transporter, family, multidrug resistance protein [Frankiales bacterium]|nr:transporter, family, multidrug resistance protein [Frankiales bacterium]
MTTATMARPAGPTGLRRLWYRELDHYPDQARRYTMLGIVVLSTVILYYENYIGGAVATQILAGLHMSFNYYVYILVVANGLGAFASLAAGLADKFGRANLVAYGLVITGALTLFGIPNASTKMEFAVITALLGVVEGVILVATPALVRDFSPQLGRASAMGFWTLGPVVGSLVVSEVSSHTLKHLDAWQDQFIICGVVGLVVAALALVTLRELAPALRDQLMVSMHDKALVEARARGVDVDAAVANPRQVLTPGIVASAFAIGVFLLGYYTAVAFFPIFFQTVQGFTADQANGLLNWYWASNAISLVVAGVLSDRLRVRKPFMLFGSVFALVVTLIIRHVTPQTDISYSAWAFLLTCVGIYGGFAFACWMASFTETVEAVNPALTAYGLAVWGWLLRVIVAVSFLILPHVISSVTPLVEHGATVQAAATREARYLPTVQANQAFLNDVSARYPDGNVPADVQKAVVEKVGADVALRLTTAEGKADFALLGTVGTQVQKAQKDSPGQWQTWFLICALGQLFFIPMVFVLKGHWSPRKAREEAEAHEAMVDAELRRMASPSVDIAAPRPAADETPRATPKH